MKDPTQSRMPHDQHPAVAHRRQMDRARRPDAWRGSKRFNELRREIPSVSQRMLTLTLRNLERDGLVNRTVTPTIPPRVDYELTELGQSLQKPICGLATWAMDNVEAIHEAQARFDAEHDKAEAA